MKIDRHLVFRQSIVTLILLSYSFGKNLTKCAAPSNFRAPAFVYSHPRDDFLYHTFRRIDSDPSSPISFLFLGGSISQSYFFVHFIDRLKELTRRNVTVNVRAHGGTDILYSLYCVDILNINSDFVFIDFRVNDPHVDNSILETYVRKINRLNGVNIINAPIVTFINFAQQFYDCSPPITFLNIAKHYRMGLIDLCRVIMECFGGGTDHRWSQYSKDLVHPNGPKGAFFIGELLTVWWNNLNHRYQTHINNVNGTFRKISSKLFESFSTSENCLLPKRKFNQYKDHSYNYCETLNDHSVHRLVPLSNHSFYMRTRTNMGHKSFKRMKRCWEAWTVGANITFAFHGSNLIVAIYQHPSGMGIVDVFLDQETSPSRNLTGHFDGFPWAIAANKTMGRQETFHLYDNLEDDWHNVTFVVTKNPGTYELGKRGHNFQLIALLYESNYKNHKL